MSSSARDYLGQRGEVIVSQQLLDFCGNPQPYFAPHPLGEKRPTFDFLVELVNVGSNAYYFLVQVKATKKGYANGRARLKVGLKKKDVQRMVCCPIPTYLFGVDEPNGSVYIVSIHGSLHGPISSIPTTFPLNAANLKTLWKEVRDYWERFDPTAKTSAFTF